MKCKLCSIVTSGGTNHFNEWCSVIDIRNVHTYADMREEAGSGEWDIWQVDVSPQTTTTFATATTTTNATSSSTFGSVV